ncbi:MAG TPA: hypothetical protein VD931_18615 [Baekduia sp.]|nr:hypothetical protein [Baekduia sp.]
MTTKTYKGRSLEEVLPKVRAELGDDAVILDRRETLEGGVGGFFAHRLVEVDAAPAAQARVFAAELERAEAEVAPDAQGQNVVVPPPAPAHRPHVDARVTDVTVEDLFPQPRRDSGLASLFAAGREEPAPAPAVVPEPAPAVVPEPAAAEEPVAAANPQPQLAEDLPAAEQQPVAAAPDPAPWTPAQIAAPPAAEPAPLPARRAAPAPGEEAEALAATLAGHGLPRALADQVVDEAVERLAPLLPHVPLRELAATALARRVPVAPLAAGPRVVALAGGPARTTVGSALLGALAAAGRPVAALTLQVPDAVAATRAAGALVVLDAGLPEGPDAQRAAAIDLRAAATDEVHLVVTSAAEARELVKRTAGLGVTALAAVDVAPGELLGLAIETGIALSYLHRDGRLELADPAALARELAG